MVVLVVAVVVADPALTGLVGGAVVVVEANLDLLRGGRDPEVPHLVALHVGGGLLEAGGHAAAAGLGGGGGGVLRVLLHRLDDGDCLGALGGRLDLVDDLGRQSVLDALAGHWKIR